MGTIKLSNIKKPASPLKIKTIILAIAIAIVLTGFVILLIQSIYPSPKYDDYCGKIMPRPVIDKNGVINETKEICESEGGTWRGYYCDYYTECQKQYDEANNKHKLTPFIIALIAGLIAISIGIVLELPSVSSGLMLGGTFLTFYGVSIYWSNLTNWLRTIILGIALLILIWLGYKKLGH